MLTIDVITLFPGMFAHGPLQDSMLKIAQEKKKLKLVIHDLRDYTLNKHRKCDDTPYGGGPGMVMTPEPIFRAVEAIRGKRKKVKVVLLSPAGDVYTQEKAKRFAKTKYLTLICGHYEGVDDRVRQALVDEEISLGDYVLTGGELPAMCVIDSVARLLPGVLGNDESIQHESFYAGKLDHPHFTRPQDFRGMRVPEVLLSGDHQKIEQWRQQQALMLTRRKRPDLLQGKIARRQYQR